MNCTQTQSLLTAYLDGEVTPSEKAMIQAHLSDCSVCQQELTLLSTARSRVRTMLQHRTIHAVPSPQAWAQLEARLAKDAQPSSTKPWFSRLAPGMSQLVRQFFSGGVTMQKRPILAGGMAFLAIAIAAILIFNNVTPVSAQQILQRAAAAQASSEAAEGIWHTVIEVYENPTAIEGNQAGTTSIMESFIDNSSRLSRYTTVDTNGKLLEASTSDASFDYYLLQDDPGIVHRVARSEDDIRKGAVSGNSSDMAKSLFEHYKNNPRVELLGEETRDGRQVYILIDRNFQTSTLPNGEQEKIFTGTMQMIFDAKTYALLESQTTVFKNNQEIVIEKVRFLVDESLPADTNVVWDLSDLQNVTFVDDEPQEEAEEVVFTTISQEELATHPNTYILSTIPDGFTQEIIESPEQPAGEPYRYEVHYDNTAGASFELMAVGYMDPGFVEKSFYDGSYKASSGMILYYSSSKPENSTEGTSGMLVTPDGASFLLFSSMSRSEVEALIEDLIQLK